MSDASVLPLPSMIGRRQFFEKSGKGALGTAMLVATAGGSVVWLEGCDPLKELETWVPIGLTAFDTVISYINPAAGTALAVIVSTANGLWAALSTAIANYEHTTDPTNTLLEKVIAAMDALQSGLQNVLNSLPPGLSAAVLRAVQFGFNLILGTLKSIEGALPAPSTVTPTTTTGSLKMGQMKVETVSGVTSATSVSDFVNRFNQNVCVVAGYKPRMK